MVLYPLSPFKNFKMYYVCGIEQYYRPYFQEVPSYERFVQIIPKLFIPLSLLLHSLRGEETGVYVADSTKLAVCKCARRSQHRVFKGLAHTGKTTVGWFFGLKLHVVLNNKCELMGVKITAGNRDDRSPLPTLARGLKGLLIADKGYISKKLFKQLWEKGIHLLTGIRKTMRNYLLPLKHKLLLRKRFIIETFFDQLKSSFGIEHTRHRSASNAFAHLLSALVAHAFYPAKPIMKI